jgi:hypothetical protein
MPFRGVDQIIRQTVERFRLAAENEEPKESTMKRQLLMTTAAIALLAGMNAASAQMGGQPGGGGDQPRMQNSPSGTSKGEEKIKPGVHEKEPGAAVQHEQKEKSKMSQGQNEAPLRHEGQTGQKEKMGQQGQGQIQGQGQMEQKERSTQQGTQKNQIQGQDQKQGTQQQGAQGTSGSAKAKSVQLSTEQRTKVRTTLINSKVERVTNVNFSIRVGARVPRTVHFYPLPVEIVEIVPEYQGYEYVLVGDEILIIDPVTLEIVAILPA